MDQSLAGTRDSVGAGFEHRGDLAITAGRVSPRSVRLQQDTRFQQLADGAPALLDQRTEARTLVGAERDNVHQVVTRSRRISGVAGDSDSGVERRSTTGALGRAQLDNVGGFCRRPSLVDRLGEVSI